MYSAAYCTLHYKEILKSFAIIVGVGHCPGFGLHSVAICHDCAKNDVKQYSLLSLNENAVSKQMVMRKVDVKGVF